MDHTDSWKNKNCFTGQIKRNLIELNNNYPQHWLDFLTLIKKVGTKTLLDVGCGSGVIYKLCEKEYPLLYTGVDYSSDAVDVSKTQWGYEEFYEKDYKDLTKEYLEKFDTIHLGALLDVLPDGDKSLESILSLSPKNCIITRIRFTDKKDHNKLYQTPYGNKTYEFYHNKDNFYNTIARYGYSCTMIENNNNINSTLLVKNE